MPTPVNAARRLIVGAALIGCLARAAFGLLYWQGKPLTHDEREYLSLAANLAAGRGFTQTLPDEDMPATVQQFGRAPLYPLFLAPLTLADADLRAGRLPDDVPWAIKIAQALVGGAGVWLIGLIARRTAGDRAGMIAAAIAAIYPPLVWSAAFALSETLYSTLALAAVWVLSRVLDEGAKTPRRHASRAAARTAPARRDADGDALERGDALDRDNGADAASGWVSPGEGDGFLFSSRQVAAGGMLAGLATLTRPAMLFFLPFALLLAWRRRPALAVWLLCGALAVVLPWTARNVATYGRFVLVASEGGITFWTGNHPEAGGEGDLAANPHLKELNRALRAEHPGLSEEALESVYYRQAFAFIASQPGQWLGLIAKKLFYTWVPIGPSYRLHSARYFWASVLSYGAVLPFAVLGTIGMWRARWRPSPKAGEDRPRPPLTLPPLTLWSLAGSALLVCVIFFPQERFRIPVIDPTLIIGAAAWFARPDRHFLARR